MAEIKRTAYYTSATLKAYYRMESGALTTDESGEGHTLTNVGSVASGTGKYGGCADLGASNSTDWFYINDNLDIDGGAVTIAIWVKLKTEIGAGVYKLAVNSSAGTDTYYKIEYSYNGGTRKLDFSRTRAGVGSITTSYNITLGTSDWYHIVLTYDTTDIKGYVNGVLQAPATAASGNGTSAASSITLLGNGSTGSADDCSSCMFDDVAVFSVALNATQVLELYYQSPEPSFLLNLIHFKNN